MRKEAVLERITLENVGFDLKQAAAYHSDHLQRGINLKGQVKEMSRELRSYESESLEDNVFSFYPYYIRELDGERRIFSADISNPDFLAISQIDSAERDGAVVEGFERIEEKVAKIQDRGFFIWISTDGDSGLRGIKYRYHQVYIGEIDNNVIHSVAFKSDISPEILAEWLIKISNGEISLPDLSPHSFIRNPVVLEDQESGSRKALRELKEVLSKHGRDKFYKDISIDKVIMSMPDEKIRQELEIRQIAEEIMPRVDVKNLSIKNLISVIGNKLYGLYIKYKDRMGNVVLTGCAGGTKSINELFAQFPSFGLPNLSTASRVLGGSSISEKSEDYNFDHQGECVVCHADPALLGPCDICVSCDKKMGGQAVKKAA